MEVVCPSCDQSFAPCHHVPGQSFCSKPACQRERKRRWQRKKLAEDPDYRATRAEAQRAWLDAHPDYWRKYRCDHPDSTRQTRELQRERNRRRRHPPEPCRDASVIAKTDALPAQLPEFAFPAGLFRLVPESAGGPEVIAKKDAFWLVELRVLSAGYPSDVYPPSPSARVIAKKDAMAPPSPPFVGSVPCPAQAP